MVQVIQISYVSDIILDEIINNDQSDIFQPSTSQVVNNTNQQGKLDNEIIESKKIMKKGYNFNAAVETSRIKQIDNKRHWDKTTNCIYCEKSVTNFTRHIIRNHSTEIKVSRYISFPKGPKDRADLADSLRKRGNVLCYVGETEKIKPVRRPNEYSRIVPNATNYLPCKHCFGMYKNIYLCRHEKNCKNATNNNLGRNKAQADAQNLLLIFGSASQELVKEVFPRMLVDNISFVAKSDELIKAFGSIYLKSHKEKYLVHVVSHKMRTLVRLLTEMKLIDPSIKTLQDCLIPKHFDSIVKSTKIVAGYDSLKDSYEAPSVILKIGNMLKQCCDIAEFNLLKSCNNLVLDETN